MNWSNAAIGKINSVLHGLEAKIEAGTSTITDPQFLEHGQVRKFSLVLANFPFSDEFWWLKPELMTDDKKKKDKLKKEVFGKEGYKDTFGRFGRGTPFRSPPASYGDYAFILHILASQTDSGRAGVVCPQGVLFRGQPEVEEETGEFDDDGNPKMKRRKADDEHLIRQALLESRLIDAVISLPLNVFYGAGVPACLFILRKDRPKSRKDQVLLVYAARHYRELSNQNELRPQDVMRMLVHYHAYGDAKKVPGLVQQHRERIRKEIERRETEEVERLKAEYAVHADKLAKCDEEIAAVKALSASRRASAPGQVGARMSPGADATRLAKSSKSERDVQSTTKQFDAEIAKLEKQREKPAVKLGERDERIAETRRRAEDDRRDVAVVCEELIALYNDPDELLKHARVVSRDEIEENEFNLNIPRYVDTFEPKPRVEVKDAVAELKRADGSVAQTENVLMSLLREIGYQATAIEVTSTATDRAHELDHSLLHDLLERGLSSTKTNRTKRPSHWQTRRVDEVAEVGSGVTLGHDVSGFKSVELPYLRVANVQDGHLNLSTIKTVRVRVTDVDGYRLLPGDVLMTEGGDLDKLGRGTIWDGQIPDCIHQNHIFRVRANRDELDPVYFSLVVESDIAKRYFNRVAKRTTNLASTNKTQLRAFQFPAPPLPEQEQIAKTMKAVKAKLSALVKKEQVLRELKKSLMHDLLTGRVRVNGVKLETVEAT